LKILLNISVYNYNEVNYMTQAKTKEKVAATAPTSQPEEQKAAPTINVEDLGFAAQYIDVAFRRGAFAAAEAAEVGLLYNKLAGFVAAYNEQVAAAKKNSALEQGE
jgi:hypothetical protein